MDDNKKTIIVLGNISPPIYACLASLGKNSNINLSYLDTHRAKKPWYANVMGNINWLSYDSNSTCLAALAQMASTVGKPLYVVCVSYHLAKEIRALNIPGLVLLYATEEQIVVAEDKGLQTQMAESAGLDVLPTWHFEKGKTSSGTITFPLVLRPLTETGGADFKVTTVHAKEQLNSIIEQTSVIAQPLEMGAKVLVHCARDREGNAMSKAYKVTASFQGFTLAMKEADSDLLKLEAACAHFLDELDYVGICHFDFISHGTKMYFLDLNLRLGGTTNKVAVAGYDEASLLFHCHFGTLPSHLDIVRKITVTNKFFLVRAVVAILTGKWTEIDYPHLSRLRLTLFMLVLLITGKDEIYNSLNWKYAVFRTIDILVIIAIAFVSIFKPKKDLIRSTKKL